MCQDHLFLKTNLSWNNLILASFLVSHKCIWHVLSLLDPFCANGCEWWLRNSNSQWCLSAKGSRTTTVILLGLHHGAARVVGHGRLALVPPRKVGRKGSLVLTSPSLSHNDYSLQDFSWRWSGETMTGWPHGFTSLNSCSISTSPGLQEWEGQGIAFLPPSATSFPFPSRGGICPALHPRVKTGRKKT